MITSYTTDSLHRNSTREAVNRYYFTLIEMLVVVGVIIILAGFLMPVLTKAKGRAVETKMMGNIRQIHLANIQYKSANDEMLLMNTLSGGTTVGIDYEPLKEHGFTDALAEDLFRLTTLTNDTELESMSLPLSLNDFHSSGRGLLYFNFHPSCPTSAIITRDTIRSKFGYDIPEDTTYMIFGVGADGNYDTFKPRSDFIFLGRESNANIEKFPDGR